MKFPIAITARVAASARPCLAFVALSAMTSAPRTTLAQPPASDAVCTDQVRPLPPQRLLRRLSLDLRGQTPARPEIEALEANGAVSGNLVDSYLESEAFIGVIRRHHEDLLWPNIDQIELIPDTHMLYPYPTEDGTPLYLSALRAAFVRAAGTSGLFVPCRNEPATYDADGQLIVEPIIDGEQIVGYQEGYVEVEPYWAPGTTVRVCALDALDADVGAVCPGPRERYPFADDICVQFDAFSSLVQGTFRGTPTACNGPLAILAPECGCGPNLRYCTTPETEATIRDSLLEQELRIVEQVVRDDQSYDQILATKRIEFNGPVAHYLQYMSRLTFDTSAGIDPTALPPANLTYTDSQWTPVDRVGRHAGVLTTPGYLLKFQTGRQRAHRFYNAFECSAFIPNGPLPSPFEPCSQREDLTQRCGCDACHQTLEPLAAHWGRYAEYGFQHMSNDRYPTVVDDRCTPPVSSMEQLFECFRFYELDPVGEEEAYEGYLLSYVFRTAQDQVSIDEGPTRLVEDGLASGRLDQCTVKRMWNRFMRRDPTADEESTVISALIADYIASGRSLKSLIKAIVLQPAYGRLP